MTGLSRSSSGLETRRKRLLFRSWHRGMREMDLLLGRFVEARIDHFDDAQLSQLEDLLELPDQDLLSWVTDQAPIPEGIENPLIRQIATFHRSKQPDAI